MTLFDELRGRRIERDAYMDAFSYGGAWHPLGGDLGAIPGSPEEKIGVDFRSYVNQVYKSNGVVAACITARLMLITEARFTWRRLDDKRTFPTSDLALLERPWPNGSTGELLARMEQDATLAGNSYFTVNRRGHLRRMRPDWVTIVIGSEEIPDRPSEALDAEVVGYIYNPGGMNSPSAPVALLPEEVAHFSPLPDPDASFRGMSWLTPVLRDVSTDKQLTDHKAKFLENGGVPSMAITYPAMDPEKFKSTVKAFEEKHTGWQNAHKVLHLAGGADPHTLGLSMRDLDYRNVQGGGETRICMAARVPAVVVGTSESLGGSSLNQGNYGQARRQFGEQYAYPTWRMMCEALSSLLEVPAVSELWYDTTDVAYLREDERDAAEVNSANATTIASLVREGFTPDSAVRAVTSGDFKLLVHTGRVSVQLYEPDGAPAVPTA